MGEAKQREEMEAQYRAQRERAVEMLPAFVEQFQTANLPPAVVMPLLVEYGMQGLLKLDLVASAGTGNISFARSESVISQLYPMLKQKLLLDLVRGAHGSDGPSS